MGLKSKFNYFDAFEKQMDFACELAELLVGAIDNFTTPENLLPEVERAHAIEKAGDEMSHQIFSALAVDFITPIEREDIIAMTQNLDDVIDRMESVLQRFYMLNVSSMHPRAGDFARLLLKSCNALRDAMHDFGDFKKSKRLQKLIISVGDVEEEADELFFRVVHDLYTDPNADPINVFVWDKIFKRMENAADACEHVMDTMSSVILKNA